MEEMLKYCIIDDDYTEKAENQDEGPDEEDDNVQSFWDFLEECNDSCDDIDATEKEGEN
jgi:hypothetical protein